MMNEKRTYQYSGKWLTLLLGLIMFTGCTLLFHYKAINNTQGLIINHSIELDVNDATIFFWILFVLSLLMTLMTIFGMYFKLNSKKQLIIDEHTITIPPVGFQKRTTIIPFAELSEINETKVSGNRILNLYSQNEKCSIMSSLCVKKKEYNEIKELITQKINEVNS